MRPWYGPGPPLLQENKLAWIVLILVEDVHEILWLCPANRSHTAEKVFGFLLHTLPDCEGEENGTLPLLGLRHGGLRMALAS